MERQIEINTQAIEGKLHDYQPLEIINVNRTVYEALWDEIIRKYHYLGYEKTIGQRIKYLVLYLNTPIAAISYNRASLRVGVRDTFIGWNEEQKLKMLHQVGVHRYGGNVGKEQRKNTDKRQQSYLCFFI